MTTVIEQNTLKNLANSLREEERRLDKQFKTATKVNQIQQDLEEEIHRMRLEIIRENHLKEQAEQKFIDFQSMLETKHQELVQLQSELTQTNTAKKVAHQEAEIQVNCLKQQLNELRREKQERLKQERLEKDRAEAKNNRKFGKGQQGLEKPLPQYKIYSSSGGFGPKFQESEQYQQLSKVQPPLQHLPPAYQQFQY